MSRKRELFEEFFRAATGGFTPYDWQTEVATEGLPQLLPVPTGLGNTEGAALAWAWRFASGFDEPRHLVYCLPMRSLVTQAVQRLRGYFDPLRTTNLRDVALPHHVRARHEHQST